MTSTQGTREQVKALRAEGYRTREERIERVKLGHPTIEWCTPEDLKDLLPGRKIEWLSNVGLYTLTKDDLWAEHEAIVHVSHLRLDIDYDRQIITFQDREWQTRTVRMNMIFTLTIRVIPERALPQPTTRRQKRNQMTRRIAV